MEIKLNRCEISLINNLRKTGPSNCKNAQKDREVAVPSEENLTYILNKAKSGNEMAAVQIDEWIRFCKPRNNKEKCILYEIKKAADEIFE